MLHQLDRLFKPRSIVVVGTFGTESATPAYRIVHNLAQGGYRGKVFSLPLPVNNWVDALAALGLKVDLAILVQEVDLDWVTAASACGEAGTGGLALLAEPNGHGALPSAEQLAALAQCCRQYGMRWLGHSSIGFMHTHQRVNAGFLPQMALPGNLALLAQSGALLTSILDWSVAHRVGFSFLIGPGAMADVDLADLIDYLGSDAQTSCILIYMESLVNARRFMSAARAFSRYKPIIVLKAGRSQEGGAAALSHTGALAGNDRAFEAAFRRAGVIRVDTVGQLFNIAQALAMQPRPRGKNLAIVTNGGGPGILATDYLVQRGGTLAQFSERTRSKLSTVLLAGCHCHNPVDLQGDQDPTHFAAAVLACLRDEGVDGVLAILSPTTASEGAQVAQRLVEIAKNSNKPVLTAWMGEGSAAAGRASLEQGRIPHYRFPESAVDAFLRIAHYVQDLELLYETPPASPADFRPDQASAQRILAQVQAEGREHLLEPESRQLLQAYGIPVNPSQWVRSVEAAIAAADQLGYPVVLKIISRDLIHKTEVGGVKLQLGSAAAVAAAYEELVGQLARWRPAAAFDGVLVEKMVEKPYEILIGARKDPTFGPIIAFGQGGVAVEVYRDMALGLPPLNMALAQRLMEGTKIFQLLQGFRGLPGANLRELNFLLCKFAYLVMDFPSIKEIDLNPILADAQGGLVVDATILLDTSSPATHGPAYPHLVISPYPEKYHRKVTTKQGMEVLLRPIRPEDEPALGRMLAKVSNDTLYMRFFGYIPKITHAWMIRFTHIDYDREMALVAEVNQGASRELVGVVRIIEDAWRETAEYSILVADHFHGQGLGSIMTDYILQIARERGIKKIVASVLAKNGPMIHLFAARKFHFDRSEIDFYEVELPLT